MVCAIRPLFVLGTRPEVIKLAPVVRECRRLGERFEPIVLATGQHQELLRIAQEDFQLSVDHRLPCTCGKATLSTLVSTLLQGIDQAISDFKPDYVVAQGDTSSVAAAAMAAFFRGIPLVHVEAGLRTGDFAAPWPEEWNRRVAALTATIHCAPTALAAKNLRSEGIPAEKVHVTGNTIVDALHWTLSKPTPHNRLPDLLSKIDPSDRIVLITAHRRENFGTPLREICLAISQLAHEFRRVQFVFPVHLNPRVQETVIPALSGRANVHLIPPVSHSVFVGLLSRAAVVMTDSGGVQEEACALGKATIVLRKQTERPEILDCEAMRLVGTDAQRIFLQTSAMLTAPSQNNVPAVNPFGDGRAASRIVDLIVAHRESQTHL